MVECTFDKGVERGGGRVGTAAGAGGRERAAGDRAAEPIGNGLVPNGAREITSREGVTGSDGVDDIDGGRGLVIAAAVDRGGDAIGAALDEDDWDELGEALERSFHRAHAGEAEGFGLVGREDIAAADELADTGAFEGDVLAVAVTEDRYAAVLGGPDEAQPIGGVAEALQQPAWLE